MKTSVVFVLLLIAAQVHGVALKGIAKNNARRHENLGKRQIIPSITPAPTTPSSTPPPPIISTISPSSPPPPPPPPSPSTTPDPPTTSEQSSDVYSSIPDSTTAPPATNSQSSVVSPIVSTYVTSVSGSLITTKKTKAGSTATTDKDSDSSTRSTTASPTGSSSSSSSSSGPSTAIIVTAIVASIIVVFGFILVTVRLFKRNKRLDRRAKALADEVDRNHVVDPSPFGGQGPAGPSMTQHPFVPPTEYTDDNQYHPAAYNPEQYYQNNQPQQYSDSYPQPPSPPQMHPQPPFKSPPAADPYTQMYYEGPGYEPRTEGDIAYANAQLSPSMPPASMPEPFMPQPSVPQPSMPQPSTPQPFMPPFVGADTKQYKPDETYDNVAAKDVRKPDVVDF